MIPTNKEVCAGADAPDLGEVIAALRTLTEAADAVIRAPADAASFEALAAARATAVAMLAGIDLYLESF